jgi:hypothetical protein
VGSGSGRVGLDQLVSGRVGYQVFYCRVFTGFGSYQAGLVIGSSNVGSFRISDFGLYQVGSGRLSGHLVSGYFGFRVVSGRVGSVIGSSSVGSFRVSDRIRSGRIGYRVI